MRILVVGYPSRLGGADTELLHVLRLWRDMGIEAHLYPTSQPASGMPDLVEELGHKTFDLLTLRLSGDQFLEVDKVRPRIPAEFEGQVVASFCNGTFLDMAPSLHAMGCKLIWVNCMTFVFDKERAFVDMYGPMSAHVMQSQFQQMMLLSRLEEVGLTPEACYHVRGAFDWNEWEFNYQARERPNDPFVVGRLARNDADKWSSNTYNIYGRIQHPRRQAWVMGVDQKVYDKIGAPPHWATSLPPVAIPAREFYTKLHCLMPINGGARENWPRVGLEAMAAGVPVVTQRQWGWKEMIVEGETGFLGDSDEELAHWAATLAWNEPLRREMAQNARDALVHHLANPEEISAQWREVFNGIGL